LQHFYNNNCWSKINLRLFVFAEDFHVCKFIFIKQLNIWGISKKNYALFFP